MKKPRTRLIDGRLWIKKISLNDTLGVYRNDIIVDIIAYTMDRKQALCIARPRDILKPSSQLMFTAELNDLKLAFLRCDYFALAITEQFKHLLKYKTFKLLINKNERKIIAVFTVDPVGWSYSQCNITIPIPKSSI